MHLNHANSLKTKRSWSNSFAQFIGRFQPITALLSADWLIESPMQDFRPIIFRLHPQCHSLGNFAWPSPSHVFRIRNAALDPCFDVFRIDRRAYYQRWGLSQRHCLRGLATGQPMAFHGPLPHSHLHHLGQRARLPFCVPGEAIKKPI